MAQNDNVNKVLFDIERLTEKDKEAVLQAIVQSKYEKTLEEQVTLNKKKYIGRPSRMLPHVTERLLIALRQGASINMACKFAGISFDLFNIWSKKARSYQDTLRQVVKKEAEFEAIPENKGKSYKLTPYERSIVERPSKEVIECVELFQLIDQAIAECGVRDLGYISKAAANGAWTAAAFRLSKRFPDEYGAKAEEQANINVNVGFNYVEVNRAIPIAKTKDLKEAERRSISAAEQGYIEVDSTDVN